jgi:hypothetical protein
MLQPAGGVASIGIVMGPVNDSTFGVPLILAVEND